MTLSEMRKQAEDAIKNGPGTMSLVFPKGFKWPKKFPRGYLLCENSEGKMVYAFDPSRIIKWVDFTGPV